MENTMEAVKVLIHQVYCALTMAKEHCLRLNSTNRSSKNVVNLHSPFELAKLLLNVV